MEVSRRPDEATRSHDDHDAALTSLFQLLHALQSVDAPRHEYLIEEFIERSDWPQVQMMALYCAMMRDTVADIDPSRWVERQLVLAAQSGDRTFEALALSSAAQFEAPEGNWASRVGQHTAAATARLSAGGGSRLLRPTAYSGCGLGYRRMGLWELELEMCDFAAMAIEDEPLPRGLKAIDDMSLAVSMLNRLAARTMMVCEAIEVGERERAYDIAQVERMASADTDLFLQILGTSWKYDARAMHALLDAAARQPLDEERLADVARVVERSPYIELSIMIMLARAIHLLDTGQLDEAGQLARRVVQATEAPSMELHDKGLQSMALSITAMADSPSGPAWEYARSQAQRRWQDRLRAVATERARAHAELMLMRNVELSQQILRDTLTGVGSRLLLDHHLARWRQNERMALAVLAVDVDRFKQVNDTYGHTVGDRVLQSIAELLTSATRANDVVIRTGGDEFLVFMPGCDLGDARTRSTAITAAIADHPWQEIAEDLICTVSIGCTGGSASQVDDLLESADRDMYQIKRGRRSRTPGGILGSAGDGPGHS